MSVFWVLRGCELLVAMRVTGDFTRVVVAVGLVVLPSALRFLVEGLQGERLLLLLGLGGLLISVSILQMSRAQEQLLLVQFELRQRAERAAEAVASVGLAKARFFAAVSHDLRQPVHAIGLYLDPLMRLSQRAGDASAQQAAEGLRQSWRALDDLLGQVLDLTRLDSGALRAELAPTELAPLVRSLVMQHSATAERAGVRLVALVGEGRHALADALMLSRVLSNLLDNAIKFSRPGSSVLLALRGSGAYWRLQVRDAGCGIAPEAQEQIFEEFVQLGNEARDRQNGLGLGLAICRRFRRLMGGSLSVRSAPGKGCCMTLSLPRAAPATLPHAASLQGKRDEALVAPPAPPPHPAATPVWPVRQVLLVEDDALMAQAMRQLLQAWGLQVRHAGTAAQALQLAGAGQPGICICNVRLPQGASGLELALALRGRGHKVLLLSGETDASLRETAQRHGLPLLTKPASGERLRQALQQL